VVNAQDGLAFQRCALGRRALVNSSRTHRYECSRGPYSAIFFLFPPILGARLVRGESILTLPEWVGVRAVGWGVR
jgi:hypothetical protein